MLAGIGDVAIEIFLYYQRSNRHTVGGSPAAVFDIHGDGYLGVIEGCEAHESRVVFTMGILGRTGLAGYLDVGQIGGSACAAGNGHAHTLSYVGIILGIDRRETFLTILRSDDRIFDFLYYMRGNEPAAVGDSGTKIGDLKGSGRHLALTD